MTKKLYPRNVRTRNQWSVLIPVTLKDSELIFLYQVDGDPDFPYVGKHVANLTLAQIKTLDCGSKRQMGHRAQLMLTI